MRGGVMFDFDLPDASYLPTALNVATLRCELRSNARSPSMNPGPALQAMR